MSQPSVRRIDTDGISTAILKAQQTYQLYREIKAEYDKINGAVKKIQQAGALLDERQRTKTLVDLGVEATYKLVDVLTKVGSALPVVAVFKQYHQMHFKVLASCAQAMSDHDRARKGLKTLVQICQTASRDGDRQLKNYTMALQDQRQAARDEAAVLRVFRPAGYAPTGIFERVVAKGVASAKDAALAKAFPQRSAVETRKLADRVGKFGEYQNTVDESLRDNRDMALQQYVEVLAAATTYRDLLWRALAIGEAIDKRAEAAVESPKTNVFEKISSHSVAQERTFSELDGTVLNNSTLRAMDASWSELVTGWGRFYERLGAFRG